MDDLRLVLFHFLRGGSYNLGGGCHLWSWRILIWFWSTGLFFSRWIWDLITFLAGLTMQVADLKSEVPDLCVYSFTYVLYIMHVRMYFFCAL